MCETTLTVEAANSSIPSADLASVVDVQLEEALYEPDAAVLVARASPGRNSDWTSPLDKIATPGAKVAVELSLNQVKYRFEGRATEATWRIDPNGASQLTVKALDSTVAMDVEEKVKAWPRVSDGDIAKAIFGVYQMTPNVEPTSPAPDPDVHTVIQRATDWAFIRSLAAKWGYVAYVESDGGRLFGHFHPLDPAAAPQGDLTFGFGRHGRSVEARVSLVAGKTVKGQRVPLLSDVAQKGDSKGSGQPQGPRSLGEQVAVLLAPNDVEGEIEPKPAVTGIARGSAFALRLTAEVTAESAGMLVRARRTLRVGGVGPALSGTYVVERVRHRIQRDEHVQELTLMRNALGVGASDIAGAFSAVIGR